ncbi:ATP-binding protein [Alicyclobacillus sp.]|uniref:ATP-binding protein n=1 Tax=Alicyclobacillus sp. TaxID=61169 RepID=UPI0025BBFE24|nr:ATP-binding protein [Alicyclobacillus sp.]MCL6517856.1 ATP-binding protein [Alicyclobacillus sp.]
MRVWIWGGGCQTGWTAVAGATGMDVLYRAEWPARRGTEKAAMRQVGRVLQRLGVPPDRVADVRTVTAEACLNALEHGCGLCEALSYEVTLLRQGRDVTLRVRDAGAGAPPTLREDGERPSVAEIMRGDGPTRGWGLLLIRSLAYACRLERANGHTVLTAHFHALVTEGRGSGWGKPASPGVSGTDC